jgi:sec-independent protein translocase protein TatA
MPSIGAPELIILLIIVLLLFGAAKLPRLARSMGEAQREFKKGLREPGDEVAPAPAPDEKVTMTRAELDAMLAERESKAREDGNPA